MQQNEKIGFIGVGLMGHGMAKNILRAGYAVTVIAHKNRVPVENLVSLGAQEASSLEELAKDSTLVFICAPGSPQVEQIIAELTPNLSENAVIIDCSTSDPTSTLKLAENLKSKRIHMVDAPLGARRCKQKRARYLRWWAQISRFLRGSNQSSKVGLQRWCISARLAMATV